MAKQHTVITLTGRLGNQVGFRRNGRYFMRAAPAIVRQSPASQQASRRFGQASTLSKLVRHTFGQLDLRKDPGHVNRLNTAFIHARGAVAKALQDFQFNAHLSTRQCFPVPPRFTKDGTLHFAPQQLPPGEGIPLEVKIVAARIDFTTQTLRSSKTMTFYAGRSFSGTSVPVALPGEGTLVVCMQVRRMDAQGILHGRHHWAAAIIAVQPEEALTEWIHHDQACKRMPEKEQAAALSLSRPCPVVVLRE